MTVSLLGSMRKNSACRAPIHSGGWHAAAVCQPSDRLAATGSPRRSRGTRTGNTASQPHAGRSARTRGPALRCLIVGSPLVGGPFLPATKSPRQRGCREKLLHPLCIHFSCPTRRPWAKWQKPVLSNNLPAVDTVPSSSENARAAAFTAPPQFCPEIAACPENFQLRSPRSVSTVSRIWSLSVAR
jgi:hypothetical protein